MVFSPDTEFWILSLSALSWCYFLYYCLHWFCWDVSNNFLLLLRSLIVFICLQDILSLIFSSLTMILLILTTPSSDFAKLLEFMAYSFSATLVEGNKSIPFSHFLLFWGDYNCMPVIYLPWSSTSLSNSAHLFFHSLFFPLFRKLHRCLYILGIKVSLFLLSFPIYY